MDLDFEVKDPASGATLRVKVIVDSKSGPVRETGAMADDFGYDLDCFIMDWMKEGGVIATRIGPAGEILD